MIIIDRVKVDKNALSNSKNTAYSPRANLGNIQRCTSIACNATPLTAPLYNIIITFDTVVRQKRNFENEK